MRPIVKVKSYADNGDGTFTLEVCDSSYLRTGSRFSFAGNDYKVVSFVNNTTLVIQGDVVLEGSFTLNPPLFITDTPQGANNELQLKNGDLDRHPFVWLLENFPTTFNNTNSSTVADARVRLFFLDVANSEEWLNKDHRDECIKPMRNLIDTFINDLQRKISGKLSHKATPFTVTDRVRFGIYTTDRGNTESIITEDLSGVELDIIIPIQDYAIECCDCDSLDEFNPQGFDFLLDMLMS
jgi:hypothetical protein